MKTRTVLIAALMFLGLTAAAFAQATFQVGYTNVQSVIKTGLTEKAGDITFTQLSGTTLAGTIQITYGAQITVPSSSISIIAFGAYNAGGGVPIAGLSINSISNSSSAGTGTVIMNIPGAIGSGAFQITGVRVAIGGTNLASLNATISTTNNSISGSNIVPVISAVGDGLTSVYVPTATSPSVVGKINGTNATIITNVTFKFKEGFLNAFNDINPSDGYGVGFKITLNKAPTKGITVTFPQTIASPGAGAPTFVALNSDYTAIGAGGTVIGSTSTDLNAYYRLTSTTDPNSIETLTFTGTLAASGSNTPYAPGEWDFSVSLWPNGVALNSDGSVVTCSSCTHGNADIIPRYLESYLGPYPLFYVVSSTTTLLAPYAIVAAPLGVTTYDTGFAIANTTKDVGASTGFASPTAQSGTVTFYLYPMLASGSTTLAGPYTYTTTAGSPGSGLDANGKIPSGGTYIVMLGQILAAAAAPANFTGYAFVVTNFTNAHSVSYVIGPGFSQNTPVLVITQDRTSVEALNN